MGLDYEIRTVGFPPDDEYLALNPLARVPYLTDGEVSIGESIAIMLHIAEAHGPTSLFPREAVARARTIEMAIFGEASLGDPMNVLLAVHFTAPPGETGGWAATATRNRLLRSINHLDTLVRGRKYLVGETLTLADISVAMSLVMWTGTLQETLPSDLAGYLDRLQLRPGYQSASARSEGAA